MGKRKAQKAQDSAAAMPPPVVDVRPADLEPAYAFPTRSRCPSCGSVDTERTGVAGNIQYRACRAPVCRRPYKVLGEPV